MKPYLTYRPYQPYLAGSGPTELRVSSGMVLDTNTVQITFSGCVDIDDATGIQVNIAFGGWEQVASVASGSGTTWTFTTTSAIAEGDTVEWRYLGAPITHFLAYGQSLSLGIVTGTASVISDPNSDHLMFVGGVRAHVDTPDIGTGYDAPIIPTQIASLVALEEVVNPGNSAHGETLASGMALWADRRGLYSAMGRLGYAIDKLQRDGDGLFATLNSYQNLYAAVLYGKERARELGTTYAVAPIIFKQGEQDAEEASTKATWKAELLELQASFAVDLAFASQTDTSNLPIITDQMGFQETGKTYGELAVASIELHRESAGKIICAGPVYTETYSVPGSVHLSSAGYRNYGERLGRIITQILSGTPWHPCHITAVSRTGTAITVTAHVPVPPLVVDTTLSASIANYGFAYSGATITNVEITDEDAGEITITINADVAGTLSYAYENGTNLRIAQPSGPRGNIRDSEPAVTLYDGHSLANWLCVDSWSVA